MRHMMMLALVACFVSSALAETPASKPASKPADDLKALSAANNAFAIELYNRLSKKEGDVFISPYSIQSALLMTWAGAKGDTAAEMYNAMCLPVTKETYHERPEPGVPQPWVTKETPWENQRVHDAAADWIKDIDAIAAKGDIQLQTANAIWPAAGSKLVADYVKLVKDSYRANAQEVVYPEPGRTTINQWAAKKTNDRIKDVISERDVSSDTKLVLTNAIYFKGDWATQFDKKLTKDEPFNVSSAKSVKVPMMRQKGKFGYLESETTRGPKNPGAKVQLLEMPYKGDRLSMVIILPENTDDAMSAVELNLSQDLGHWLDAMRKQDVNVVIPRWKIEWRDYLNEPLKAMGMKKAFGGGADFTGIDSAGGLFIGLVIHKSFVEVNEEGSEAAAVTVVIMPRGMPARPVEFRADRPFLFLIRDTKTGAILFMGRVTEPKAPATSAPSSSSPAGKALTTDFTDSRRITLTDLNGSVESVVNLWNPWCRAIPGKRGLASPPYDFILVTNAS